MKGLLCYLILLGSFTTLAQTFTKLNDAAILNRTSDWFTATPVDIDNNYSIDLILGNNGSDAFFLQTDSLQFTYNNSQNFVNQTGNATSSFWADIDNDCDLDVFWPNRFGSGNNFLYKNNGDGTFTRIQSSILTTDSLFAIGAGWGDFDNDGLVDLFISREYSNTSGLKDRIYKNTGNFTFTRIDTGDFRLTPAPGTAGSWVDFDNDGDLDLYIVNRSNYNNHFYINDGNGGLRRDTSAITQDGSNSTGCSWGDYDNDGYLDVYITNAGGEKNLLYKNNGDGTFTKQLNGPIVNDLQHTYGSFWADFDNDGFIDLFIANGSNVWAKNNVIYKNNGNGTFSKINSGYPYSETLETVGASGADLNEDGFVDIIAANRYNSAISIFLNDANNNGYLHLNLLGTTSNRSAIGARVVAKSALGKQTRVISQEIGFASQDDLSIKMGFAQDNIIDSLTIYWPSGNTCIFTNVNPKGFYNIEEGTCVMDTVPKAEFADSSRFLSAFFINKSNGPINRYHWDFGDGDTSDLANPTHRYTSSGLYPIELTVYDNYCKHRTYRDTLDICPDTSVLGFIDTHNSLTITYTDTSSSEAYDFQWDFGDNSVDSGKVVTHTYAQSGTYNVCLTLTDSCRSKIYCRNIGVCNDTLLAGFSMSDTAFTVTFNDSSLNAASVLWDFGDGTSSTSQNPTHTYSTSGNFIICQTAQDACTSTTWCDTISICLDTAQANFAQSHSGKTYSFTDLSKNAASYSWNFGDGNFSSVASPVHTFQNLGTYNVCLTITNECYTDSMCTTIPVCDTLIPGFGVSTTGFTFSFTDTSSNATGISWSFGDGSSSVNQNAVHTYSMPGRYVVCQTIQNACATATACDTIEVCLDTAQADFSVSANGQVYNFTNQSAYAKSYIWDFGDGNMSNNKNPAHIFQNYGIYKVCLTVSNDCYQDSICKMVNVCSAQGIANYTFKNSIVPLSVQFTNQSQNAISYLWDFGDGSSSTNKNPINVYTTAAVYDVCLTITDSCGLQDSICHTVDLSTFGISELEWMNALEIYPNPTHERLFIKSGRGLEDAVELKLLNMKGQLLLKKAYKKNIEDMSLDLSALPKGIYLLKITSTHGERNVKINRN